MAEAIFRKALERKGLQHKIEVDSCGTGAYHIGELPDYRARNTLSNKGIQTEHRARQFQVEDFDQFDYILPQDESNLQHILRLQKPGKEYRAQVFKMRHFDPQHENQDVPDPYFGGADGFEDVFEMLTRSCNHFLDFLLYKHPELHASA
jgi:protein-tyrosine phosphatase